MIVALKLVLTFPLATITSPLMNSLDSSDYSWVDGASLLDSPSVSINQASNGITSKSGYPELVVEKPAEQSSTLISPDLFELSENKAPTSARPCPGKSTLCARKIQYFPFFRCYPCDECRPISQLRFHDLIMSFASNKKVTWSIDNSAADPDRKKCDRGNVFCCDFFNVSFDFSYI